MRIAAILLSLIAGCIITSDDVGSLCGDGLLDQGESCDDGNNTSGDGCSATCQLEIMPHSISASWKFETVAGATQQCPDTYREAIVMAWKLDANDVPIGDCTPGGLESETCYMTEVNCLSGNGFTRPIPDVAIDPSATAGRFRTAVAIVMADKTTVYARTLPEILDVTDANKSYPDDPGHRDGTILTDGGYFLAAWTLRGAMTGASLTCGDAHADSVRVTIQTLTSVFKCTDGAGISGALVAGSYDISVTALDAGGQPIGAPTTLAARGIQSPNVVTDLGGLQLGVDGL